MKIGAESRFTFVVRGLVNTEGGQLRFASGYDPLCEICDDGPGVLGPFPACGACGRGPTQGGRVISGDGDGIYPIVEVIDSTSEGAEPIAILVVFDSNYELANRISADAQRAQRPDFTANDVVRFFGLPVVAVSALEPTDTVVLGGGRRNEPAVDCAIQKSGDLIARAYVETSGRYTGNFANFNADNGTTISVPRLLAIGTQENLDFLTGKPQSELTIDWEAEDLAAMTSIVTSHAKVVADEMCFANANIADSYLQDMSRFEHLLRNWDDDFFSWVILGADLGNKWCIDMLSTTFGVPNEAKQIALVRRRIFDESKSTVDESKEDPQERKDPANRFCSNCGRRFENLAEHFCPACGTSRG